MPTKTKRRALTPEDNYLLRTPFDPQISPDGTRVAYVLRTNDREKDERQTAIWVAPIDGKTPARRFTFGTKDHSPRWSPDGRYLAFVANRDEKKNQIFLAPLDGGEARQLTHEAHGAGEPVWAPDSIRIAYVARTGEHKESKERTPVEKSAPRVVRHLRNRLDGVGLFDDRRTHVFVADIESGDATQITDGDWFDTQPSWSPDGRSIVFASDRERARHDRQFRSDVWLVAATGGRARRLTRAKGAGNSPSFSPDGRWVAFAGHEHGAAGASRHTHIMLVPPSGDAPPRSISARIDRTVTVIPPIAPYAWTPDSKAIIFAATDGGAFSLYRTSAANGAARKVLGGQRQISQFVLAPDGKRVAFLAQFSSEPPEVYAARLATDTRERNLSHANDEIRKAALGATKRISYRAPDGLAIEAFVIYPPSYSAGTRYPLVLEIHGGPHGTHPQIGFNMRPQALAAAGYVVLMPNPRGSGGYGEAFTEACVNDWGGKDYEDLMAGVDVLIEKGIADPARLFVTGYSYGGFMTTWTVGHTTRFKAAIIGAPVADHVSMAGTTDIPLFSLHELGGTMYDNRDEWIARSPLTYLDRCTTPVMIEHHEGDLRCPVGQSEEIFQALKLLGKEVEFVRYPGGFHTLVAHAPSQDADYQRRSVAWFDAHGGKRRASRTKPEAAAKPARNGASRDGATAVSSNGAKPHAARRRYPATAR